MELSHYTAQWLNLWMDAEDDEILEQLHQDWESTLSSGAETLDFYRTIKEQCPETVFHGTDVGHQYDSTGARYQDYLEERGLAVIQQRFDPETKATFWTEVDDWLTDPLYLHPGFRAYFDSRAAKVRTASTPQ